MTRLALTLLLLGLTILDIALIAGMVFCVGIVFFIFEDTLAAPDPVSVASSICLPFMLALGLFNLSRLQAILFREWRRCVG